MTRTTVSGRRVGAGSIAHLSMEGHAVNRFMKAAAASIVLLMPLSACGNDAAQDDAERAKISIGTYPISGYLQDFVAQKEGFFAKNGLDATVIPSMAGATALQLMSNNKLQSYGIDFLSTLQAAKQGSDIRVAACLAPRSVYVVIASEAAGLPFDASFTDRVKALKGKTVGVTALGAGTDRALVAMMSEAGMDQKSVQRIAVGVPSAAAGQLAAGRIDAYVTGSHSGAFQVEKSAPKTALYLDSGDPDAPKVVRGFAGLVWAVSGKWAKEHPEQVDDYVASLKQARDWIVANPKEAAQIMSQQVFGGADEDVAEKSAQVLIDDFYKQSDKDLTCPIETFNAAATVFEQQGLGKASDIAFEDIVLDRARS